MEENDLSRQEIRKRRKKKKEESKPLRWKMSRERTRLQRPSGYVLETTTLIDAIIMTSEKNKKKKNREKELRTLSLSLSIPCRCYSPRTTDRICVLLLHTHIDTHKTTQQCYWEDRRQIRSRTYICLFIHLKWQYI
jgi:hypothetical protein